MNDRTDVLKPTMKKPAPHSSYLESSVAPEILKLAKQIYSKFRPDLELIVPNNYSSWGSLPRELKQSIVELATKEYWGSKRVVSSKPAVTRPSMGIKNRKNKHSSPSRHFESPHAFNKQRVSHELRHCNQLNPRLRLEMPPHAPLLVAPELEICIEFFWRYQRALSGEDGGLEVARLLIELETVHPVEWQYSGWKADAIARLALGTVGTSPKLKDRRKAFDKWSLHHWKLLDRQESELDRDLSPLRQAAANAALELDRLQFSDELTRLGITKERISERERMGRFIDWLKREWRSVPIPETKRKTKLPLRRLSDLRGDALLQHIEKHYRGPKLPSSLIEELCEAFQKVEPSDIKKVTLHNVLLQLVAARNSVSARSVSEVRSKMHDQ